MTNVRSGAADKGKGEGLKGATVHNRNLANPSMVVLSTSSQLNLPKTN